MDEILFGKERRLADQYYFFPHGTDMKPCESDHKTISKLGEDIVLEGKDHGNVFIVFLDSTHFDYDYGLKKI